MRAIILLAFFCLCFTRPEISNSIINYKGGSIIQRFDCPKGFYRISRDSNSFHFFLQNLKLKDSGTLVKYYDGSVKNHQGVYAAVIDKSINNKDLHQCADAVIRLKAEYLYQNKKYKNIEFLFNGDNHYHGYTEYCKGDYSISKFYKYLDYIYSYANTASLKKQLKIKPFYQIDIGDVLIQSKNPYGHAVIVVDICQNSKGEKKYMLAQSYMPAQEIQILLNENKDDVWYSIEKRKEIYTPEWTFDTTDLRTWHD